MDEPAPGSGRRRFLNLFLNGSFTALFAAVLYPIARFMMPPRVPEAATNQVEAGFTNDPELIEKGFKIVPLGSEPVILIRVTEEDYRAFAATCTHLDCIVEYQKGENRIWCNCHNGAYDLSGRNTAGPPPKPLPQFEVHVVANERGPGTLFIARS